MIARVPGLDRNALLERYHTGRERTSGIFALIDDGVYYERPIPLRHPFVFYDGHVPAFAFVTLCQRALGESPIDSQLQRLFERGIDPGSLGAARQHQRDDWPRRDLVAQFGRLCDERVERALETARLVDPSRPMLVRAQAAYTVLEHEEMHQETLLYIVHQVEYERKGRIPREHHDTPAPERDLCAIPAGTATIGADRDEIAFGWDNEFEAQRVAVDAFAIDPYPVTNARWLRFLADGGPRPPFWIERDGEWFLRAAFEELPLPLSWPVYVSHDLADAYARWAGARLPSEAEFHRAAFGTPQGIERAYPWGEELPSPAYGNFDFERFDPEPAGARPAGASAWGVEELIGNGWEWTATPFAPLPGFAPMASYPQYSADFFDGRHYVMKGASPVTARGLIRRSLRNWFYADYPYAYAKCRLAVSR